MPFELNNMIAQSQQIGCARASHSVPRALIGSPPGSAASSSWAL